MRYTGPIYRPPLEYDSLLLQVTVGCAYNSCTFCTMYKSVDFSVDSMAQVEENLKTAQECRINPKRVFLVNGDAFVLNARRLKEISNLVTKYLPTVETITMYCSIRNIMDKTDEDLVELRDNYKINDLYIGVETGHDDALKFLNKGYTSGEAIKQLKRLDKAGMAYIELLMLGTLGRGGGIEAARATAKLVNTTNPSIVWVQAMRSFPGSKLEAKIKTGEFIPSYELEILEEEKELIKLIDKENITFLGIHPVNSVTVAGKLPQEKQAMIDKIDKEIDEIGIEKLNTVVNKTTL